MGTNTANLTGARLELFPSFRFHVEIGSIINAVFTDCSGLEMTTEFKEYAEGGSNGFVHIFPGRTKYSHVTLKRGFILNNALFAWYREMENCLKQGKAFTYQPVSIILWNPNQGMPEMRWNLDRALPIKWIGPAFQTEDNKVAVESLVLAHHGIQD